MKNERKKEKIIVIMRHGERTDLAGEKVKLNFSDPELTDIGKTQAYNAGQRLRELLLDDGIDLITHKIAILSSPFSRTLQTAIYAMNGMNIVVPVYVENGLSEFISTTWFTNSPKNFLCYFQLINNCMKQEEKVEIVKPEYFTNEFMNYILIYQPIHPLPEFPESTNNCSSRFHLTLDLLVYYYLNRMEFDVILLVTHVVGLNSLCEKMEIPMDYYEIEYCSTFIFTYNLDEGNFKFQKNFYPIQI